MSVSAHRRLFAALATALLALHLDSWNAGSAPLLFGWLPWDLAYHLLWMAVAALLVLYMTSRAVWPDEDDDV